MLTTFASGLLVFTAFTRSADAQVAKVDPRARAYVLYAPSPEYSRIARARGWGGTCLAEVEINPKTGLVTSGRILKSTGYKILDDSAVEGFKKWHFKPGGPSPVKITVTFVMERW